jgi:hypothetical protein
VHEHVGERDGGTSTSTSVLGDREHEHEHTSSRRIPIWGGFDRRPVLVGFDLGRVLESHRTALELTNLINRLVGFGFGVAERERAKKELRKSREKEQKKRAEWREQNVYFRKMVYGKNFRKPFS